MGIWPADIGQGNRAVRVSDETDHLQELLAEFDPVAVPGPRQTLDAGALGDGVDVGLPGNQPCVRGGSHTSESLPMITVAMGGDDRLQWLSGEQSQKSIMVIGRVDQHTRA